MATIRTQFTELLGITVPVVSPPMAYGSGGAHAAQVTLGGGFGFIGVGLISGPESVQALRAELETARSHFSITDSTSTLPIGVGLIAWLLDRADEAISKEIISLLFEYRVKAVWLSFGDSLGSWFQYIRDQSTSRQQQGGSGILIFVQIHSLLEAQRAITEWKPDVVVAQGIEGGGHGAGGYGLPLSTLLALILYATSEVRDRPPIIAAGGLATGSQVASVLTLGASAAVVGTRFLLSPESLYSDAQRTIILNAESTDAVRSDAFDAAWGTLGWPKGINGRAIRNVTYDDYENGVGASTVKKRFDESVAKGEADRLVVWAGLGVGLMNRILPVREIVKELHEECLSRLNDARKLVA